MLLDGFFPPDIQVEKEARSLLKTGHQMLILSAGDNGMPDEETVEGIRVIRKKLPQNFPQSELAQEQVLTLPMYPELSEEQIEEVIQEIRTFAGR
jgi:hypothetical protein